MNGIQSVDRAADILEFIGSTERGATLSEVMAAVKLPKTTTHRFLKTLLNKGFLDHSEETGRYQIGVKFYVLGRRIAPYDALIKLITPVAQSLHSRYDEVINVSMLYGWTENGYRSIIVHKEQDYNKVLSANPLVGRANDCHCSAVGKCLLAFSDRVDIRNYEGIELKSYTPNTITDYAQLQSAVDEVRRQGYAIDDEEQEKHLYCIGVPVLLSSGEAIAAMSVSGRKSDMMAKNPDEMITRMLEASRQLRAMMPSSFDRIIG